ncbi:aminotransferase class V-fold PLP-dependent enzyme, partial [Gemmatimonadota bacterium]
MNGKQALAQARETFPATRDLVYLDAAAVSLISQPVHDTVRSFLDLCIIPSAPDASQHHRAMDAMRRRAVQEAARLLNAQEDEVALVESTTHGLNIAANAIPLEAGDKVLVADTEFLQVAIPWKVKESTVGIEVVPVRTGPDGILPTEHFLEAMDARTRVVCVSSVQWCSGYRIDLA